jgi:hypothetical protein
MPQVQCPVCRVRAVVNNQGELQGFQRAHSHHQPQYMGLGDVVASGIKKIFGIKPCGGCQQRQQALNNFAPRVWRK